MSRSAKPRSEQRARGIRVAQPQHDIQPVARMVSRVLASFAARREAREPGDGQSRR